MSATQDMVNPVLGEKTAKENEKIPLSNTTVQRRIDEITFNVEETLVPCVNFFPFQNLKSMRDNNKHCSTTCIHTFRS